MPMSSDASPARAEGPALDSDDAGSAPIVASTSTRHRAQPGTQAAAHILCGVCREVGTVPKTWRKLQLHAACWNAVRCHQRMLTTQEAKAADKELFESNVPSWQEGVQPLVAVGSGGGGSSLVQAHRKLLAERETFQDTMEE